MQSKVMTDRPKYVLPHDAAQYVEVKELKDVVDDLGHKWVTNRDVDVGGLIDIGFLGKGRYVATKCNH